MIPERFKIILIDFIRAISWAAYPWYRWKYRRLQNSNLVVGCETNYVPGWINMTLSPFAKKDLWFDYRSPVPFPFPDQSFQTVYSANEFEHFYCDELQHVLKECYRVLKPGGALRICVPSLEKCIAAYTQKNLGFFTLMPDALNPFKDETLGARFSRHTLVNGGHKNMFDFDSLRHILEKAGFKNVRQADYQQSNFIIQKDITLLEDEKSHPNFQKSLYLEALKVV